MTPCTMMTEWFSVDHLLAQAEYLERFMIILLKAFFIHAALLKWVMPRLYFITKLKAVFLQCSPTSNDN